MLDYIEFYLNVGYEFYIKSYYEVEKYFESLEDLITIIPSIDDAVNIKYDKQMREYNFKIGKDNYKLGIL